MLQLNNNTPFAAQLTTFPDENGIDTFYIRVKATYDLPGIAADDVREKGRETGGQEKRGEGRQQPAKLVLSKQQIPLVLKESFMGSVNQSSILYASEIQHLKQTTDIIVVGHAYASPTWPQGFSLAGVRIDSADIGIGTEMNIGQGVAANASQGSINVLSQKPLLDHKMFVCGDWSAQYSSEQITQLQSPQPFQRIPLAYERSFGGSTASGERVYDLNPVGCGLHLGGAAVTQTVPLPNFLPYFIKEQLTPHEYCQYWLNQLQVYHQSIAQQVMAQQSNTHSDPLAIDSKRSLFQPAGFGVIAPTWQPRRSYLGTYGDQWQRTRAPFLPEDFDSRFYSAAHPSLQCSGYLLGNERVTLTGLRAEGDIAFQLPADQPELKAQFSRGSLSPKRLPPLLLETVLIEPDEKRLALTWCAKIPYDKDIFRFERFDLSLKDNRYSISRQQLTNN